MQGALWECSFCHAECSTADTTVVLSGEVPLRITDASPEDQEGLSTVCQLDAGAGQSLLQLDLETWCSMSLEKRAEHSQALAGRHVCCLLYLPPGAEAWSVSALNHFDI